MIRINLFLCCLLLDLFVSSTVIADTDTVSNDTPVINKISEEEATRPTWLGPDEEEVIDYEEPPKEEKKDQQAEQSKKHLTLEQELAEEYKRIIPRPGAVIDPNTGEEVVVDQRLYDQYKPQTVDDWLAAEDMRIIPRDGATADQKNNSQGEDVVQLSYESNTTESKPEFKLFSWETLIGGIIGAVILFSSILICQVNDYYKRKK